MNGLRERLEAGPIPFPARMDSASDAPCPEPTQGYQAIKSRLHQLLLGRLDAGHLGLARGVRGDQSLLEGALGGVHRRLGLHERSAYFTLLVPGKHSDYLICTHCGSIEAIQAPCPVHQLEEEIRRSTGYRDLYHELEFFGTCPDCHAAAADRTSA